jgi:hypothetical protein
LGKISKAQERKAKTDKDHIIKLKVFCTPKETEWGDKQWNERKYLQIIHLISKLISKINKQLKEPNSKK